MSITEAFANELDMVIHVAGAVPGASVVLVGHYGEDEILRAIEALNRMG